MFLAATHYSLADEDFSSYFNKTDDQLEQLSIDGDRVSQYIYGLKLYFSKPGVAGSTKADTEELVNSYARKTDAIKYIKMSAESGFRDAIKWFSMCNKDIPDILVCITYADMLDAGDVYERSALKALSIRTKIVENAAIKGINCPLLGNLHKKIGATYQRGITSIIPPAPLKARASYRQAYECSPLDSQAMHLLGLTFIEVKKSNRDMVKGMGYLKEACTLGSQKSCLDLSTINMNQKIYEFTIDQRYPD